MARRNRPARPGEQQSSGPIVNNSGGGGGGGGNRNRPNRNRNRSRGGNGTGGGGGDETPPGGQPYDMQTLTETDPLGAWNNYWSGFGMGAGQGTGSAFDSWFNGEYYENMLNQFNQTRFDQGGFANSGGNFLDWLKTMQNPQRVQSDWRARSSVEQGYGGAQQARWQLF